MNTRKEEDTAQSWCLENEIEIYPVPMSNSTLKIEISNKGRKKMGKILFSAKPKPKEDKWWVRVKELYMIFYKAKT